MQRSPRQRRLEADHQAIVQLRAESSIFSFESLDRCKETYLVGFRGWGLCRNSVGEIRLQDDHRVRIELGAAYPRMIPVLAWKSPVFHPNISANGIVCLGGYSTHWVPSLRLDELCQMLWDMIRYQNYDVTSPYNREAALWAHAQSVFQFPLDPRPLRDRASGVFFLPPELAATVAPPRREPPVIQSFAATGVPGRRGGPPVLTARAVLCDDSADEIIYIG